MLRNCESVMGLAGRKASTLGQPGATYRETVTNRYQVVRMPVLVPSLDLYAVLNEPRYKYVVLELLLLSHLYTFARASPSSILSSIILYITIRLRKRSQRPCSCH
jgi:hypothetical protein